MGLDWVPHLYSVSFLSWRNSHSPTQIGKEVNKVWKGSIEQVMTLPCSNIFSKGRSKPTWGGGGLRRGFDAVDRKPGVGDQTTDSCHSVTATACQDMFLF